MMNTDPMNISDKTKTGTGPILIIKIVMIQNLCIMRDANWIMQFKLNIWTNRRNTLTPGESSE